MFQDNQGSEALLTKIYITGTPGTGKTSVCQMLSTKKRWIHIEVNSLVAEGEYYLGYDADRDSMIIDEPLVVQSIEKKLSLTPIKICISGPILEVNPNLIDRIFVFRLDIPELRKRLKQRGYSTTKVEENIEAEIMDISYMETLERFPPEKVTQIETGGKSLPEIVSEILKMLNYG